MTELTAICDICYSRITPAEGALWVDMHTVPHPEDEDAPFAPWRVSHLGCYDAEYVSMYSLDLEQVVDPVRFLGWIAHLSEKTWFDRTDWVSFLRRTSESGTLTGRPPFGDMAGTSWRT